MHEIKSKLWNDSVWDKNKKFSDILNQLRRDRSINVSGLGVSASASFAAAVFKAMNRDLFIILPKERHIGQWQDNLEVFTSNPVLPFPLDYPTLRIEAAGKLNMEKPVILLGSRKAYEEKIISPSEFYNRVLKIIPKKTTYNKLLDNLTGGYYVRNKVVPEEGDFARRGNGIDFWPPGRKNPVRVLFKDNIVESLKEF
nr:hypothetical protein [Elusimicrobiota bacterium]